MAKNLVDHLAIIDVVNRFGLLVDHQEWNDVLELLAEEIWIDYSDLDGFEPARISTKTLMQSWKEQIAGFKSVQHAITNHCVDLKTRNRATCRAHARVHHLLPNQKGGQSWILGGTYSFGLERTNEGWKIIRIIWKTSWTEGNHDLFYLAIRKGQDALASQLGHGPD